MNLTHHSTELRGAARLIPAALSLVLIAGACTTALAFRQQVTAPQPQPAPAPSAINFAIPSSINSPSTVSFNLAAPALFPPTIDSPQVAPGSIARISGGVIAGNRDKFVSPVYPADAKVAKLSGTVILRAIIGKDGTISKLEVKSSTNPIFNDSALKAVRQWTYRPYLLNGEPTEVDTTITVNYSLNPDPTPAPNSTPAPDPSASSSRPSNQPMHIGGDVKAPIIVSQADPEYSQQAKDAKFSGTVSVYLQVDTNGHTSHIRVVKGIGMGLDEKAVEAVSQYRFKPATLGGRPVPVDLYVDVNFQIL